VTQMPPRPLARSPPTRRKNEPPITVIIGGPQPRPRAPPRPDDRKPFDHFLCRPADLCGCPQSRPAEDGAAQAADDFLSAAEALADPTALRIAPRRWNSCSGSRASAVRLSTAWSTCLTLPPARGSPRRTRRALSSDGSRHTAGQSPTRIDRRPRGQDPPIDEM
jgi:hypothetical protein